MSVEFFPEADALIEREATRNPLTADNVETPLFAGVGGELYRAPMRAFSNLGAAGTLAVAGALRTQGITAADDTLFPIVDRFRAARDWWTAEPGEVGTAGRVVGGLAEFGTLLGVGLGNPALALGTTQMTTATDLAQQGVAPLRAVAAGTAEGAANAVAFQVPFLGKTFAQRVLFGAGANAAAGAGVGLAVQQVLQSGGYDRQAEAYDPWNLEARAIDALTGALFGGVSWYTDPPRPKAEPPPPEPAAAGAEAPPPADAPMPAPDGVDPRTLIDRPILDATWTPDPELLDASALLNAHQHRVVQLAPGRPRTPEALDAHVAAIRQAVAELAADEPVTASVRPDEFEPLPPSPEVQRAQEAMREVLGPELDLDIEARRVAMLADERDATLAAADAAPPVEPDPVADGERPKLPPNLNDGRIASPIFRTGLGALSAEVEVGGAVSLVTNADGDIVGRSRSVNPPWFQQMAVDQRITVNDMRGAVDAALAGRRLGARQARVVRETLTIVGEREGVLPDEFLGRTQAEVDAEARLVDMILEERAYEPDWDIEARDLMDVAAAARRIDPDAVDGILESQASDADIAERLQEIIDRGRQGESSAAQAARDGRGGTAAGSEVGAGRAASRPAAARAAPDLETQLTTDAAREAITADPELQIVDDDGNVLSAADALAAAEAETRTVETLANGTQALAACAIRFMGG
jgi:hypothetical protein